MKVVILAGGLGTRMSEETDLKPKPMVEIGGKPILWHIMKIYSKYGFNDFIICCGYKGYMIKDYFHNYHMHQADITIDLRNNRVDYHDSKAEPWRVTLIDTGHDTMTGGRLARVKEIVGDSSFHMTYGDGVGDINIRALVEFHTLKGRLATLTAVQPTGRFGALDLTADNEIRAFKEKPRGDGSWVNAGFFVLEPGIFDYIDEGDASVWEKRPLERLAEDSELNAFKHSGFWMPMDTLRDKHELEKRWAEGNAPWKVWQ